MFGWFKKPQEMTPERAEAIINAYGAILMRHPNQVCDRDDLPFQAGEIKEAIWFGLASSHDPQIIEMLKAAYVTLSDFLLLNDQERIVLRQQREWDSRVVDPAALTREDAKAWIEHQAAYRQLLSRVQDEAVSAAKEIELFMRTGKRLGI